MTLSRCWTICGIARAHLLGYSMGGAIAQEVAIRHPDRIDRLILFATFCGGIWSEPASYSVFSRLLTREGQTPEEAARAGVAGDLLARISGNARRGR